MTRTLTQFGRLTAVAAACLLALTGCASTAANTTADDPAVDSAGITIVDAWVKSADSGMSAAFGELTNASDHDVTVVAATSEASDMIELHETVADDAGEMVMQAVEGGFVIPAGGSLTLEPGADHIMLMGITGPLEAGGEATFVLTFSDDSTYEFTAPIKDFSGANENYVGDDHDDMDMDE